MPQKTIEQLEDELLTAIEGLKDWYHYSKEDIIQIVDSVTFQKEK